jgi:Amiloride-sensitive sodium channel
MIVPQALPASRRRLWPSGGLSFCPSWGQTEPSASGQSLQSHQPEDMGVAECKQEPFFAKFCSQTSLHALPDFAQARGRFRAVWLLVFILGLCGASYEIYQLLSNYLASPVITTSSYSTEPYVDFPEVMLCNSNFINASKVRALNHTSEYVDAARRGFVDRVSSLLFKAMNKPTFGHAPSESESPSDAQRVDQEKLFLEIGYDTDQFLRACLFQGEDIPCTDITTPIFDKEFGKCFLVKMNRQQKGDGFGLLLLFDLHLEETWGSQPSQTEGAFVYLFRHYDPTSFERIHVSPGKFTKISLDGTFYHLEAELSGNCQDDMPRQIMKGPYSPSFCNLECWQRFAHENCDCIVTTARQNMVKNFTICQLPEEQACLYSLPKRNITYFLNCLGSCRPPCKYWRYASTVSYTNLLTTASLSYLRQFSNESQRWDKNFVIIDVAFKEVQHTVVEQFPSVTTDGFIGQIGGHLGLFLGASLISLVQYFVLLAEHLWGLRQRRAQARNSTTVEKQAVPLKKKRLKKNLFRGLVGLASKTRLKRANGTSYQRRGTTPRDSNAVTSLSVRPDKDRKGSKSPGPAQPWV